MRRTLALLAALATLSLSADAWNLQGVRIGKLNFNGADIGANIAHASHESILNTYAPRIKEQLLNAGIQPTGDPGDFTLSMIVSNACGPTFCGGAVEVYVSMLQDQRLIMVWQARTPFVGYPVDILPNLVGKFIVDYLRDNRVPAGAGYHRPGDVIEIPGGPVTQK